LLSRSTNCQSWVDFGDGCSQSFTAWPDKPLAVLVSVSSDIVMLDRALLGFCCPRAEKVVCGNREVVIAGQLPIVLSAEAEAEQLIGQTVISQTGHWLL